MGSASVKVHEGANVVPCPRCANAREFTVRSQQVCEDGCEIWVVCKCGFDPTVELVGFRQEDVHGTIDKHTTLVALDCWNDALAERERRAAAGSEPRA